MVVPISTKGRRVRLWHIPADITAPVFGETVCGQWKDEGAVLADLVMNEVPCCFRCDRESRKQLRLD